ncbi:MAG: 6-bladed beta-propeller [Saprospiraceae bacterium]|nr:6-bladed beta-propeller [Saprospiraceae bacterium]
MSVTMPAFLALLFCFCLPDGNNYREGLVPKTILVEHTEQNIMLSDVFVLSGFTLMETGRKYPLRGMNKILFEDENLYILDNGTDFQNIWVVDEKTGRFTGRIGEQGSTPDAYEGLNDIVLHDGRIACSVAAKMSVVHYDKTGNATGTMKTGIFGEELEYMPGDRLVVYNEYNATPVSGNYHLLFYDRKGNLTKKAFPYAAKQDGNGFAFTGSISNSNGTVWFNPPFSDTVYEITSAGRTIPRFVYDFGSSAIPATLREEKLSGWDTHDYAYVNENFISLGRFVLFGYFSNRRIKLGVFDEFTGKFLAFQDAERDHLYELLQLGDIFPKDNHTFALVLRPSRIEYLKQHYIDDLESVGKVYPKLAEAIWSMDSGSNPLILYLSFLPGASIGDQ